jgi:hypothetical protein
VILIWKNGTLAFRAPQFAARLDESLIDVDVPLAMAILGRIVTVFRVRAPNVFPTVGLDYLPREKVFRGHYQGRRWVSEHGAILQQSSDVFRRRA